MPTYHYVQNQGKLIMQSQENGQKPQFGQFFDNFKFKISKLQIFLKTRFYSNWRSYLVLTSRCKTKKIVWVVFEKNMKVPDFGLIWIPFLQISPNQEFFSKIQMSFFYLYSPLTSCKKSENSLELFLHSNCIQPTNQLPTTPIL